MLEVWSNSVDLVNYVFHADNAILAKLLLNDGVVSESNALLVDLSIAALVNELTDGLEIGITVSNEWFDNLQHLKSGLGQTNEDTIVDLKESQKLKGLALLWINLVDTLDTDNEDELWFLWNIERAISLGDTSKSDPFPLSIAVLLDI